MKYSINPEPTGCHEGCVTLVGSDHEAEINPCDDGKGGWRSECPQCATVMKIHPNRDEALVYATIHALYNLEFDHSTR